MKKLMVLALLFLTSPCYGSFEIQPEVSHISYREKNLPVGNEIVTVKEDGVMYGIKALVENEGRVYLVAQGKYSLGTVDYSGTGTIDNVDDYMIEARGLVGYRFKAVTLYSGYGYRYLNDDMSGKTTDTGLFGYERESSYHYIPLGIKFNKIPLQTEIDVLINGEQVSNLDKEGDFLPHIVNKQNRGAGFKASLNFKKSLGKVDLTFTPFVHLWKVQTSKQNDGFIEPKNSSAEVGGAVGIRF